VGQLVIFGPESISLATLEKYGHIFFPVLKEAPLDTIYKSEFSETNIRYLKSELTHFGIDRDRKGSKSPDMFIVLKKFQNKAVVPA